MLDAPRKPEGLIGAGKQKDRFVPAQIIPQRVGVIAAAAHFVGSAVGQAEHKSVYVVG
jgi:hypothetical protein